MNLNLIYFSPTGSTKNIVETLSSPWNIYKDKLAKTNIHKEHIDISKPDTDYSTFHFSSEDLCIIGMPSFGGRAPLVAVDRLKKIKANNTKAIIVTTYGNRAYEDTLLELKNVATECGFKVVAAVAAATEHSIMPKFGAGRPSKEDLDEIFLFGEKIKDSVSSNSISLDLKVPGNIPYKEFSGVPMRPKTNKNCSKCKICAHLCPTKSIPVENVDKTHDTCISCMRCISICPNGGRSLNKMMLFIASNKMKKSCLNYKKNELFI